ncbi:MAG: hypothetical protein M1826_004629 [Phylliscum demangeonii]|nr:MAG: hypothetical protein M1826_004629 [Phylliscum demangeonii]
MSAAQDRTGTDGNPPALGLDPDSYTAHRLQWYKHHLHINYRSRAATFSTKETISRVRQLTGLDGPSASALYAYSFPQPDDLEADEDEEDDGDEGDDDDLHVPAEVDGASTATASNQAPPAVPIARSVPLDSGALADDVPATATGPEDQSASVATLLKSDPSSTRRSSTTSRTEASFHTAGETLSGSGGGDGAGDGVAKPRTYRLLSASVPAESLIKRPTGLDAIEEDPARRLSTTSSDVLASADSANSRTSLLPQTAAHRLSSVSEARESQDETAMAREPHPPPSAAAAHDESSKAAPELDVAQAVAHTTPGLVRFNVPDDAPADTSKRAQSRFAQLGRRSSGAVRRLRRDRRGSRRDGEIVRMEKMLVKVQSTAQELSRHYDENESMAVECRTMEQWQEFVVVCRECAGQEADYTLQFYKSRVIPERMPTSPSTASTAAKGRATRAIDLDRRKTHVNLYSTLDKTVVVWAPGGEGGSTTTMYLLRPRALASAVEWYTFLRSALGGDRPVGIHVHVPDLGVTLYLKDLFRPLNAAGAGPAAGAGLDAAAAAAAASDDLAYDAVVQTMQAERAVAGTIIRLCTQTLQQNADWADVLRRWSATEQMALAWKRYDRLEWVYGANEQKMFGTWGMQRSHELQLRPKVHYPTDVPLGAHHRQHLPHANMPEAAAHTLTEPTPIEGFLVRLTSQRGRDRRRLGRMFATRLYFSTHDQLLCFSRPAYAIPPPPPQLPMTERATIPTTRQIERAMPLIYAIVPFRLVDGRIAWLQPQPQPPGGDATTTAAAAAAATAASRRHDEDAYDEAQRRVNTLLRADGYVDLCRVVRVRLFVRGTDPITTAAVAADDDHDDGTAVDNNNNNNNDDDHRTFELILDNGLTVRLEAYNGAAAREWITRLTALVRYWTRRKAADSELLKTVRRTNLARLRLDEAAEPFVGQFAQPWELGQALASAEVFNMCGIACCRTVAMSGRLYWKPRRGASFRQCHAVLCHGQLLIFQSALRNRVGAEVGSAHHERQAAIELKESYLYSGLLTADDDLLSLSRETGAGVDARHAGPHALPRVYRDEDGDGAGGWTSSDADSMTSFVIWRSVRRAWFKVFAAAQPPQPDDGRRRQRQHQHQHLRHVTALGVPGRSLVFKARSRADRDRWVMSLATEIERLHRPEEIRVVKTA